MSRPAALSAVWGRSKRRVRPREPVSPPLPWPESGAARAGVSPDTHREHASSRLSALEKGRFDDFILSVLSSVPHDKISEYASCGNPF